MKDSLHAAEIWIKILVLIQQGDTPKVDSSGDEGPSSKDDQPEDDDDSDSDDKSNKKRRKTQWDSSSGKGTNLGFVPSDEIRLGFQEQLQIGQDILSNGKYYDFHFNHSTFDQIGSTDNYDILKLISREPES